jgi:DNA-binding transcriptional LysR family regulator
MINDPDLQSLVFQPEAKGDVNVPYWTIDLAPDRPDWGDLEAGRHAEACTLSALDPIMARRNNPVGRVCRVTMINLRQFNLNLLVVFDTMMSHRSTTKAGQTLGLSQSAISSSLSQLRLAFEDELFVRHKNEMVPTARALEIAGPIGQALIQVRSVTGPAEEFDPAESNRTFRLGMNDYGAFVLLGGIVNRVREQSSNIRISVRNIGTNDVHAAIDNDDVDLSIAFSDKVDPRHDSKVLFEDEWVCARRAGGKQTLTLDDYLAASHIVIGHGLTNHVDRLLKAIGVARTNRVSLPFCLAAPALVEESDLLVTLPSRLAREFSRGRRIEIRKLPFHTRGFPVLSVWHTRRARDPGLMWLRELIASTTVQLPMLNVA